jgi:phthiodiolone/phenolphthiodiolone dimycocerosates ketoreductase
MPRPVETAITLDISRHLPLRSFIDRAQALEATGVVDQVHVWDQLTSWWPREMWNTENTPLASIVPDIDSFPDVLAMAAVGAATTSKIGMSISTDAIRRGPAELTQTMMTISNLAQGTAPILQLGAGELKQMKPFGWKRSQGLGRFEDHLRYLEAFWGSDDPVISLEGNHWNFDHAWIGGAKGTRPRVWGLGGGPKLLDLTTTYADGFCTIAPSVWTTPEHAAQEIGVLKQTLETKGRDPEAFDFAIWPLLILHDEGDEESVQAALQNPLIRWLVPVFGRIHQPDWRKEGLDPPMPDDWHYAMKLLPIRWTEAEVHARIKDLPPEMMRKSFIIGTPEQAAERLRAYVEAGVTWIMALDMMPFIVQPDQLEATMARSIKVCELLKRP